MCYRQYEATLQCVHERLTSCSQPGTTAMVRTYLSQPWALHANYLCHINQKRPSHKTTDSDSLKFESRPSHKTTNTDSLEFVRRPTHTDNVQDNSIHAEMERQQTLNNNNVISKSLKQSSVNDRSITDSLDFDSSKSFPELRDRILVQETPHTSGKVKTNNKATTFTEKTK